MDFELNEEQQAFQEAAREFAGKRLAPNAAEWDAGKIFPKDVIAEAGELGFCGIYSGDDVGGMGLPRLDAAVIFEQLAAGCTSTTAYITIHNMVTWMIDHFGSAHLRERYCEKMTSGEWLGSYCLTEPGSGSDAASLRTSAVADGDHYLLNGAKAFVSGAGATDVLVVMARTSEDGARGITSFVVKTDTPGISFGESERKMGWNSQPTRMIHFDDVRVPADHVLGKIGIGFKIAMKGLDGGRINIAACSLGAAQKALEVTQSYMLERKQFGRSLSQFQALQFKFADMATNLVAARQMVYLAASKLDAKHPNATTYCALAKRFATDTCFDICNQAIQLHGGYGYTMDYPVERLMRDTRVHQILEGTNEIMRLIISRQLLQEDGLNHIR